MTNRSAGMVRVCNGDLRLCAGIWWCVKGVNAGIAGMLWGVNRPACGDAGICGACSRAEKKIKSAGMRVFEPYTVGGQGYR